jgi:alpha-L-fucosidase
VTFDVVSMQEAVDHRGQRIESFSFDTWDGSKWVAAQPILLNNRPEEWTTVGFKRLLRLRSPETTDQVRIRINQARLEPALAEIGLFKQAEIVQGPVISERDTAGAVTLSNPKNLTMVYTTDGSAPSKESAVYRSPISLRGGGTVNAACVDANGRLGMTASKRFWGNVPTGWKVIAVDNREPAEADNAARAIDGDPSTMWQSSDSPLPHSLTVDMGSLQRIGGLCYIPPRGGARGGARGRRGGGGGGSGSSSGAIDAYRFETSEDGKTWTVNINEGRFGNIRNNPVPQEVRFAPVTARFFRFTAVNEASGNNRVSVAEITVLPAEAEDVKR